MVFQGFAGFALGRPTKNKPAQILLEGENMTTWDITDAVIAHWKMDDSAATPNVIDSVGSYTGTAYKDGATQNTSAIASELVHSKKLQRYK